MLYSNNEEHKKSEPYFKKATIIKIDVLGDNDIEVAWALNNVGVAYSGTGNYRKAELMYNRALSICKAEIGVTNLIILF